MAMHSPEPTKHIMIADTLRRDIDNGRYPVGGEIPSEAVLVQQFQAARGTVRQAIATLKSEGLIHTSRGRRPIVQTRPMAQSIDDFFSFSSWVRAQGKAPGQKTLEIARRRRLQPVQEELGYPDSEFVVHVVRLRLVDGLPTMIERSTFDDSIGQELLTFDTDSGSIFEFLIERGAQLDEGTHVVDAVAADALDAELLEVEQGSPILRVRRVTTTSTQKVLEYSEDRYRPDRASIRIQNSRKSTAPLVRASRAAADPSSAFTS